MELWHLSSTNLAMRLLGLAKSICQRCSLPRKGPSAIGEEHPFNEAKDNPSGEVVDITVVALSGETIARLSVGVNITASVLVRQVIQETRVSAETAMMLVREGVILQAQQTLHENGVLPCSEGVVLTAVVRSDKVWAPIGTHPQEEEHLVQHGYKHAEGWKLLTRQIVKHGMFSPGELSRNSDPAAPLFTDLEINYDHYRAEGGELVFKVIWPDLSATSSVHPGHGPGGNLEHEYMLWSQTSAPMEQAVRGMQPIFLPYPSDGARGHPFGGAVAKGGNCLLHGSTNGFWWYCFAACSQFAGGIPGPCLPNGSYIEVQHVELWIAQF